MSNEDDDLDVDAIPDDIDDFGSSARFTEAVCRTLRDCANTLSGTADGIQRSTMEGVSPHLDMTSYFAIQCVVGQALAGLQLLLDRCAARRETIEKIREQTQKKLN